MERKGVHVIEKNVETCQNSGSDYIIYLVDGYLYPLYLLAFGEENHIRRVF